MKHLKRALPYRLAACVLLLLAVLLCVSASAEETESTTSPEYLSVTGIAKPATLVVPGDTQLVFTFTNLTGHPIPDISLTNANTALTESIGQLGANETINYTETCAVSQENLDAGALVFVAAFEDPLNAGTQLTVPVQVAVSQVNALAQIEFTRQLSGTIVTEGDTVTACYTVTNTGNVALSQLRVTDPLGDYAGQVDVLDVGETVRLINRMDFREKCISQPTISYVSALSGANYSGTLTAMTIAPALTTLSATLTADAVETPYGQRAQMHLFLSNDGNVNLYHLQIADPTLGQLIDAPTQLLAGKTAEIAITTYPLKANSRFAMQIGARTEAGDRVRFESNEVEIDVPPMQSDSPLRLSAHTGYARISGAGDVTLTLELHNDGAVDLTNVTLSETAHGYRRVLDVVPAGEPTACVETFTVAENTQFQFAAAYVDASGAEQVILAVPVTVEIAADGIAPVPHATADNMLTVEPGTESGIAFNGVFLVCSIVLLGIMLGILIYITRRDRKARRARMGQKKSRLREDAKVPHAPVFPQHRSPRSSEIVTADPFRMERPQLDDDIPVETGKPAADDAQTSADAADSASAAAPSAPLSAGEEQKPAAAPPSAVPDVPDAKAPTDGVKEAREREEE